MRRPTSPPLFPYTTLFRSRGRRGVRAPAPRQGAGRAPVSPVVLLERGSAAFRLKLLAPLPPFRDADILHVRAGATRSEEHTSELQSLAYLVCRLLLEKKINLAEHHALDAVAFLVRLDDVLPTANAICLPLAQQDVAFGVVALLDDALDLATRLHADRV